VLIVMWAFFAVVSLLSKLLGVCDRCYKPPSMALLTHDVCHESIAIRLDWLRYS
jgi:hypothetical protein